MLSLFKGDKNSKKKFKIQQKCAMFFDDDWVTGNIGV